FWRKNDSGQDALTLQENLPFQPTTEWKTFTFKLSEGALGAGTVDADLEKFYAATSDFRFNVNLHEPFRNFGYDGDNALYLDNVKLEVVSHPAAAVVPTYGSTVLEWNMDDKGTWYNYGYDWSQNDTHAVFTSN